MDPLRTPGVPLGAHALRIPVIDSHTEGEPTRVVMEGAPELGPGDAAARLQVFREQYDSFRSAVVDEPRGSEVLVGALLLPPSDPTCCAAVIFFNNVGCLGMCGHGTMGLVATLAHLGRIGPGEHRIETPVGVVTARLAESGEVSVRNVPSYRLAKGVAVPLECGRTVTGDVAWGGNWFFLCEDHDQELSLANQEGLTDFAWEVRRSLARHGITGMEGAEIDHVELFGPPGRPDAHSRSFVLCPGGAYDRSPCGTGTSAKLACLAADGKLRPGQAWRQESIIGSVFEGTVEPAKDREGVVIATLTGRAYITAEATLLLHPDDPYRWGIR